MALAGKAALVTGAGSGIGRSIARMLAGRGVAVAVLDVVEDSAAATASAIRADGGQALALAVDVTDSAQIERACAGARAELGAITVLVNVAGISEFVPFLQISLECWRRMIDIHLNGTFHCTRTIVPDMIAAGWGRIVNISSVAGMNGGGPALAHYAAAKGAILGFSKALAHELGPSGITVNVIAPGLVDTPMVRQTSIGESLIERMGRTLPVRRVGEPSDIAAACAYLVSEEAGFLTGQVISPNGGAYL